MSGDVRVVKQCYRRMHYEVLAEYLSYLYHNAKRTRKELDNWVDEICLFFTEQGNFNEEVFRRACGQRLNAEDDWRFLTPSE